MRFLHTSDWHVGKTLRNQTRDEEYRAVLAELLDIARQESVDCLLVAGDTFDSAVPSPEAERIVFDFFRELVGARIPAVVIGGNHEHPRRLNAFARVLDLVDIHVRGEPVPPESGGSVEVPSRDGQELAVIAALPWVHERKVRTWDILQTGGVFEEYGEHVAQMIEYLSRAFRPDTINILLAHVMVDGAIVGGEGSGERPLHIGQAYAIKPQRLPTDAHYVALGHLHRSQEIVPKLAYYSGSPLQLDFGESGQQKSVYVIDASPGRPAQVQSVPLNGGRCLRDVRGTLENLRGLAGDPAYSSAYLRVFVIVERPVPGLADQVRELLPNAIDIVSLYPRAETSEQNSDLMRLGTDELFVTYYRQGHGAEPPKPIMDLFRRLYDEVGHETP